MFPRRFAEMVCLLYLVLCLVLQAGCATVAMQWHSEETLPVGNRAPVETGGKPFRILVQNMQLLPPPIGNTEEDLKRVRRIAEMILSEPDRYDALCLIEVFNEQIRAELVELLSPMFPHHVSRCETTDVLRQDSGLCLFSRFPFARNGKEHMLGFVPFDFEWTFTADMLAAKGVLGVPLDLSAVSPGHTLWVFVSHLQCDPGEIGRFADVRARQLGQIREFMDECAARTPRSTLISAILTGDLNVPGSADPDSEYARMLDILGGPRDLFTECRPEESGGTCDGPADLLDASGARLRLRLDYILAIDDFTPRGESAEQDPAVIKVADCCVRPCRDQGEPLSDHDGVDSRLSIERKTALVTR